MDKFKAYFKRNLTIPNILSVIRLVIIIPLVISFLHESYIEAGIYLLISGLSDMFDGAIARKFNQVTQLGKILDPIADKLTLIAVVICLAVLFPDVLPIVVILMLKDIIMLIGGAILLCMKIRPPAAKWYGKVATAIFYVSITTIVCLSAIFDYKNWVLDVILMSLTVIAMIVAFVSYAVIFVKLVKNRKNPVNENSNEKESS